MARYIDADKLKKRIYASPMFFHFGEDGFFIRDAVLDLIEKFPIAISTADVVEVKRGEWVYKPSSDKLGGTDATYDWMCSVCKDTSVDNTDFCPNCGAKMDGGKAE